MILDPNNVGKTERFLPWDELSESYYKTLCSSLDRPAKDARIVIGGLLSINYRFRMKRLLNRFEKTHTPAIFIYLYTIFSLI